jgi:hypothetical protein
MKVSPWCRRQKTRDLQLYSAVTCHSKCNRVLSDTCCVMFTSVCALCVVCLFLKDRVYAYEMMGLNIVSGWLALLLRIGRFRLRISARR